MKKAEGNQDADMLDEYDFTGAVRGKYAARYAAGVTVTVNPAPRPLENPKLERTTFPRTASAASPRRRRRRSLGRHPAGSVRRPP